MPYLYATAPKSATTLEIRSDEFVRRIVVDQAAGCGSWRDVGTFDLAPGATLRLVGRESYGTVIADGFALCADDGTAGGEFGTTKGRE